MSNQRIKTPRQCMFCNAEFFPFRASKGMYCSNQCKFSAQRERRKRVCLNCQQMFTPPKDKTPKFCSHDCYCRFKISRSFTARTEAHIDKSGECWIWTGGRNVLGYGRIYFRGRFELVHRLMYAAATGEDLSGKVVRHYVCDNPPCCNPAHLKSGSKRDNTHDAIKKRRHAHGETSYAKLTADDVRLIRDDSRSSVELAKLFGVAPATVRHARKRETWKHLG